MTEIIRKVGTIKNGVVIDHITNGKGLEISKILKLDQFFEFVVIAQNLNSNKLGKKDLIKIEGKELTIDELNKIALITKSPTINIIRDQKIFLKKKVEIPKTVDNILICNNPNCISNTENINSKFYNIDLEKIDLVCHYCEKKQNEIKIK